MQFPDKDTFLGYELRAFGKSFVISLVSVLVFGALFYAGGTQMQSIRTAEMNELYQELFVSCMGNIDIQPNTETLGYTNEAVRTCERAALKSATSYSNF